jgi:hypothetical protein
MSNYTKEDLEKKVKKDLVKIAFDSNLDIKGNREDLIARIYEHKPSFEEMVDAAPVSKNGDLEITIEEEPEVDVGVEVNDAYPEQTEEVAVEVEKEVAVEDDIIEAVSWHLRPLEDKPAPEGMVAENTAEDILKAYKNNVQGFYRKNTSGSAPARPEPPEKISEALGVPAATGVLAQWRDTLAAQLRPTRGLAPLPPKTVKQILQVIKSL